MESVDCNCIMGADGEIVAFCAPHMGAIERFTAPLRAKLDEAIRIKNSVQAVADGAQEHRLQNIILEKRLNVLLATIEQMDSVVADALTVLLVRAAKIAKGEQ